MRMLIWHNLLLAVTAFLLINVASNVTRADFIDGWAAFDKGDWSGAFREWRHLAENGDPRAQTNIGILYETGQGVPPNFDEAERWLNEAAKQGFAPAQRKLAYRYLTGRGFAERNYAKARHWYLMLAQRGDIYALRYLSFIYENGGPGLSRNLTEAYAWYAVFSALVNTPGAASIISKDLNKIASRLSQSELAKAQKMADERYTSLTNQTAVGSPLPPPSAYDGLVRPAPRSHATPKNTGKSEISTAEESKKQRLGESKALKSRGADTERSSADQTAAESHFRIQEIQKSLAALGYDPGSADGILGPKTHQAIREYQRGRGATVTGEASQELYADLLQDRLRFGPPPGFQLERPLYEPKLRPLEKDSTGSGFVVSREGHILTNYHVVGGCREIRLPPYTVGQVMVGDTHVDLALLKAKRDPRLLAEAKRRGLISQKQELPEPIFEKFARFNQDQSVRPGDEIIVIGFPLHGLLTSGPTITTGAVSALSGPADDRRILQITAPVQQGNSGGPLLDLSGNIAGVVVGKLNALKIAALTGDIPQNVNFAVSAESARAFLDAHDVPYETAPAEPRLEPADVAAKASEFTVLVECWK